MKETKTIELSVDKNYLEELDKLAKEGWVVVSGTPIVKLTPQIVGKSFVLERAKEE